MAINSPIAEAARRAHLAHLCVMPPMQDGSKRPIGEWTEFQRQRPTETQIEAWYRNGRTGLGFVCGAVSANLEALDFDERSTYERYLASVADAGLTELVDRIEAGYL